MSGWRDLSESNRASYRKITHKLDAWRLFMRNSIRDSRLVQTWLVFSIASFIFLLVYYGIILGSRLIPHCGDIFATAIVIGILTPIILILHLLWLCWRQQYKGPSRESDQQIALSLLRDSQTDQDDEYPINPGVQKLRIFCLRFTAGHETRKISILKQVIFGSLVFALVASSVVIMSIYLFYWNKTLPSINGSYGFPGVKDLKGVTIARDGNGMIHITGNTDNDIYFAQGWACAQERLFQMDFQRRLGKGTLSEILGAQALSIDKFFRTLSFYSLAKEAEKNMSTEAEEILQAYINGVNSYLEIKPPLPLEFHLIGYEPEPFSVADILVWAKMMSLDLSGNLNRELLRYNLLVDRKLTPERIAELFEGYPDDAPTVLSMEDVADIINQTSKRFDHDLSRLEEMRRLGLFQQSLENIKSSDIYEENKHKQDPKSGFWNFDNLLNGFLQQNSFRASNNWVISGQRTVSGLPLLSNDPHLMFQIPSIWILMHLENSETSEHLIGATFAGVPGIIIGRNEKISWGVTNVGADVQDLYIIDEDPHQKASYWADGKLYKFDVKEETIKIKGASPVKYPVKKTIYGPVINDVMNVAGSKLLALRWVTLDSDDTGYEAFRKVMKAKNWNEFRDALRHYTAPSQNFIYADLEGHIGYQCPGRIPQRKFGHSGAFPVHSNGSFSWDGYIPFDQLPRVLDPVEGFIASANNKVVPSDFPHQLLSNMDWEEQYRAERIREMILSKEKLSKEDMISIQGDVKTLLFREFRFVFQEMLQPYPTTKVLEWRNKLIKWDGVASVDSKEATVFETWFLEMSRLPSPETGTDYWRLPYYLLNALKYGDPNCKAFADGCIGYAKQALNKALRRFPKQEPPKWGELHHAMFEHPILEQTRVGCLFGRSVPHGGDDYTVNVGGVGTKDFKMRGGPSYRQIVDLSNPDKSLFIHPIGQSGNLFSEQFDDFLSKWSKVEYLPMTTVASGIKHILSLFPRNV